MPVCCPKCQREIAASEVNLSSGLGRCAACNIVFRCGGEEARAAAPYSKPAVQMPARFTVTQDGPDFMMTRRWYSAKAYALLFFCAIWDGFLIFFYAMLIASLHRAKGPPAAVLLFPLIHVAVGVGLTYLTAAMFVNRTEIRLGLQDLSIWHGPLPWPGKMTVRRGDLQQLFCEEVVSRGKNGVSYTYNVVAIERDGSRIKLLKGLEAPEQALFIEQKLERQLGIIDRPVAGEMRPLA